MQAAALSAGKCKQLNEMLLHKCGREQTLFGEGWHSVEHIDGGNQSIVADAPLQEHNALQNSP